MLFGVDLENWLASRSAAIERQGAEIHYIHSETRKSILVERAPGTNPEGLEVHSEELKRFYQRFLGGSLLDSMLMIASPVRGGVQLSAGYTIPDLDEVRQYARGFGFEISDTEDLFLVQSAWMFLHAPGVQDCAFLRCYDRDFQDIMEDRTFEQILEEQWALRDS